MRRTPFFVASTPHNKMKAQFSHLWVGGGGGGGVGTGLRARAFVANLCCTSTLNFSFVYPTAERALVFIDCR